MTCALDDDVARSRQRSCQLFGPLPEVAHVVLARRHERRNVKDIGPRRLLAARNRRLTEARKVHSDNPIAGGCQRFQVLCPHAAVRDTGMEQHNGRTVPHLIMGKHHEQPVSPWPARIARARGEERLRDSGWAEIGLALLASG